MTGTKRQQVGRHETHRARESRAITDRQEAVQGETSAARMKMRTDKCIVLTRADFLAHQLPQHVSAAASNTHSRFLQASLSNGLCVAPAHSQTNQPSPWGVCMCHSNITADAVGLKALKTGRGLRLWSILYLLSTVPVRWPHCRV